jgi:hypothetical protein
LTRYRVAADALAASLSDGAVLLHLYTKRYFSLNDTGSRIWALLEQQSSDDEIVEALVREYDVKLPDAQQAVHRLLEDLLAEHLIEQIPA